MRPKILIFSLVLMITVPVVCEEQKKAADGHHYFLNGSLFYPLSLNRTKEDEVNVNLSLIFGHVGNVKGFDLSLMVSAVKKDMKGVQLTGLAAIVGGSFTGLQIAGISNITGDRSGGVQIAGLFNISGNHFKGIQTTSIFNIAGESFSGIQAASVFNIVGERMNGAQLGSINFVGNEFRGFQSGAFDFVGETFSGLQLGGINFVGSNCKGFQVGAVNFVGDEFSGGQLGGVNYAANIRGFQFGAVNMGVYVNGLQLGLLNVSHSIKGIPLGIVNISRGGNIRWVNWGSNLTAFNTGLKFVVQNFYSIVSVGGINLEKKIDQSISYGFHYGFHIPLRRFYADFDLGYINIDNEKIFKAIKKNPDQHVFLARAMLGVNITKILSIYVGGGVGYMFDHHSDIDSGQYIPILLAGIELFNFNFLPRLDRTVNR